jgi:hypothetical protein
LLLLVYNKSPYIEIQNTENLEGDTAQTPWVYSDSESMISPNKTYI